MNISNLSDSQTLAGTLNVLNLLNVSDLYRLRLIEQQIDQYAMVDRQTDRETSR